MITIKSGIQVTPMNAQNIQYLEDNEIGSRHTDVGLYVWRNYSHKCTCEHTCILSTHTQGAGDCEKFAASEERRKKPDDIHIDLDEDEHGNGQ
jgi:hypothetical protein